LKNYGVTDIFGEVILFKKNEPNKFELYSIIRDKEIKKLINKENIIDNNIELLNFKILPITSYQSRITLTFTAKEKITGDYQLLIELNNGNGNYQKILPMAYGLYPTSEWQEGEKITTNYWLTWPKEFADKQNKINLSLVELTGGNEVNKMGVSELVIDDIIKIGKTWKLNN